MKNKTLVLGASTNPNRYSNIAIKRLRDKKLSVVALGLKKGKVLDVILDDEKQDYENIDSVTLYLNPKRQKEYYNYIIGLKPRRVIFNPGTENAEFEKLLVKNNIEVEIACTLVLLSTNQY
ncbi:CoA-binding protein [Polaribacter litorisediminis]|uniref:CoA-binding protein n=1 Tax=Polaribacter litorisediminis TaxID=1908341 RepID=UPI001CBEB31E|nr:CoA-binding protein [Polaribacter litorisediminis]UAM98617.1 CoA-binding protein [Polaribacter litorisediminis]